MDSMSTKEHHRKIFNSSNSTRIKENNRKIFNSSKLHLGFCKYASLQSHNGTCGLLNFSSNQRAEQVVLYLFFAGLNLTANLTHIMVKEINCNILARSKFIWILERAVLIQHPVKKDNTMPKLVELIR